MSIKAHLRNREDLDSLLKQAFAEGVRWPIERPSLIALSDMGLTVQQIARYFSIDPLEVQALLNRSKQPFGSGSRVALGPVCVTKRRG
jgi:hypothetical protein